MSLSLRRNSWNSAKENGEEKIVFASVDGASSSISQNSKSKSKHKTEKSKKKKCP